MVYRPRTHVRQGRGTYERGESLLCMGNHGHEDSRNIPLSCSPDDKTSPR
jgi:hypothetical protein